jgi:hypothetical protein
LTNVANVSSGVSAATVIVYLAGAGVTSGTALGALFGIVVESDVELLGGLLNTSTMVLRFAASGLVGMYKLPRWPQALSNKLAALSVKTTRHVRVLEI